MRVRKSAMGSVCIALLPARFHDARNFSLERHTAKTDSAHLKLANIATGAAANTAAITHADLELGLLEGLSNFCGTCHLLSSSRSAQRKPEALKQLTAFFVGAGAGGQGNVHAFDFVDAGVIDFGKHQLIFEAQGVIAA